MGVRAFVLSPGVVFRSAPLVQGVWGSNGARVASLQTISFEVVMVLFFSLLAQLFISGILFLTT